MKRVWNFDRVVILGLNPWWSRKAGLRPASMGLSLIDQTPHCSLPWPMVNGRLQHRLWDPLFMSPFCGNRELIETYVNSVPPETWKSKWGDGRQDVKVNSRFVRARKLQEDCLFYLPPFFFFFFFAAMTLFFATLTKVSCSTVVYEEHRTTGFGFLRWIVQWRFL